MRLDIYRLSRSIVANNQCERCVELYSLTSRIVERADTGRKRQQRSTMNDPSTRTYPRTDSLSIFARSVGQIEQTINVRWLNLHLCRYQLSYPVRGG